MLIRQTADSDRKDIFEVQSRAFGYDKEALLTTELLDDPTARPTLSLLAFDDNRAVGHILFTRVGLRDGDGLEKTGVSASILAPLAVIPEFQGQGVGGRLTDRGLELLTEAGVDLVFVLGHPDYYPRHGFNPAGVHGLQAPYPIPEEHAGAWMAQELRPGIIGSFKGRVVCADALNRPEHWRE